MSLTMLSTRRPFENRLVRMISLEGGQSSKTAVWIAGHLAHVEQDYPTQIRQRYNSFNQSIGANGVKTATIHRYLGLLSDEDVVVDQGKGRTSHPEPEGKFPKNYYALNPEFDDSWAFREPQTDSTYEELIRSVPNTVLDPWNNKD